MRTSMKRAISLAGAGITAAAAVVVPASAAMAHGDYHGVWTLEAFKVNGTKVNCPGTLPAPPPAPQISCKAGEYLKLKNNYRYKTTMSAFTNAYSTGAYDVIGLDGGHHHKAIVFDSSVDQDDPRAYNLRLQGYGSGIPTKMVISLGVNIGGGKVMKTNMIFRRDAN